MKIKGLSAPRLIMDEAAEVETSDEKPCKCGHSMRKHMMSGVFMNCKKSKCPCREYDPVGS